MLTIIKKRLLLKAFRNRVDDFLWNNIINNINLIKPEGQYIPVAILITNITGYVNFAEKLELDVLKEYMSKYYNAIDEAIYNNHGFIDLIYGDTITAFWGFPINYNNYINDACKSSLEQLIAINNLNVWANNNKLPPIKIRIGITQGNCLAGNFGNYFKPKFTVAGETYNRCMTLEKLNKKYNTSILIDENVKNYISGFIVNKVDKFIIKDSDIKIYELK